MANIEFKCPNCNGTLVLDPKTNKIVCEFCDSMFNASDVSSDEQNREVQHQAAVIDDELLEGESPEEYWKKIAAKTKGYVCPSCGGSIIGTEVSTALFCPYCGNPAIIEQNLQGEFTPDYIIPFKKTKEDALAAFKKFCGKGVFLPKTFNINSAVEKVTGIYVPHHLYTCSCAGNATYECENIERWSDSEFDYKKVDTYSVKRAGKMAFEKVPMDASKSIDDDFMESIEPYDYSELKTFDMVYLTGFFADKYDVLAEECEGHLKSRAFNSLQAELQKTVVGYTNVRKTGSSNEIKNRSFSYALLPVWLMRLKSGSEYYYFAMNGETGKAAGRLPVSGVKVALATAGISIPIFLLTLWISRALWLALIFGAVAGLFSGVKFGGSYKNVSKKTQAGDYVAQKLSLSHKSDYFVRTHTERTRRPKNNR